MADIFAPPTPQEMDDLFAPPKPEELAPVKRAAAPVAQQDIFAPPAPHEVDAIQNEIKNRSAFDKPAILPDPVSDQEVQQIATRHNVAPSKLRDALPFLGGRPQDVGGVDIAKGVAGLASEGVLLGAPQKIYKMSQSPAEEKALDELQDLVAGRKSYLQKGAELLTPLGIGGAAVKTVKGAAALGAGMGTVGGFAGSHQGEELRGAATGAVIGGVLGAGTQALVSKLAGKSGKLTKAETEAAETATKSGIDIDKIANEQLAAKASSEKMMEDAMARGQHVDMTLDFDRSNQFVKEQLPEEVVQRYLDPSTPEGIMIRKDIMERSDKSLGVHGEAKSIINRLANDLAEQRYVEFARHMTGDKSLKTFDEARLPMEKVARQGYDYVMDEYRNFAKGKLVDDFLQQNGMYNPERMGKLGQVGMKASDAQFALRVIDDKFGTNLEQELAKLSENRNKLTFVQADLRKQLDQIGNEANKMNLTADLQNGGKIYNALNTGDVSQLSEPEKLIADKFRQQFDKVLSIANEKARDDGITTMAIPRMENYVHQVTLTRPEIQARVSRELDKAAELASQMTGREITDISRLNRQEYSQLLNQPPFRNLIEFVNMGQAEKEVPPNAAALVTRILDSTESPSGTVKLEKLARGSMERTGQIPEFIREKDMFRVLDRYTHDLLSNLYQREPLGRMVGLADRLETAKAVPEANYVRTLIRDAQGIRPDTPGAWGKEIKRELAGRLDAKIQNAIDSNELGKAKILRTVKEMGDLPYWMFKQIYANVLGYNPHTILQNAASGFARTAPELGGTYGYQTYMRGLTYAVKNWSSLNKFIKQAGLVPEQHIRDGERWLLQGLAASKGVQLSKDAVDAVGKLGMSIYQASESMNRLAIVGTARMMANDLVKGDVAAQKALTNFPGWLRKQVAQSGNDQVRIGQLLASYLNQSTAFNYNRPSLYEYGRTMGPLFATFAKWPTAILGEALADLRTKGTSAGSMRIAQRLGLPFMAFAAADQLISSSPLNPEENDRAKKVLGSGGLKKAAPIGSLGQVASGGIFTPPAIDALFNGIIKPITESTRKGEIAPALKGADRLLFTYAPGAGFIKFLGDDLPTYITGERPEGTTGTERAAGTLNKLLK